MAGVPFFQLFVALSLSLSVVAAVGPVTDLEIVNANIAPDGYMRAAALAGGTFPGPLIKGYKGDNFKINVINKLTNSTMRKSTSIHWHGFYQRQSSWADGPAFINQCPISPGHSFLYDFVAREESGSMWYHSHLSTQYCDGLRGPIVVYDRNDPHKCRYDVDNDDTVITLADWYHGAAKLINPFFGPDSTLINGKGRSLSTPNAELSVIKVTHGKRYRFRLISLSCDPNYVFSIDGHLMTVIEADSIDTKPHKVDSIQIFAGQRYSFVLKANKAIDNYWIRANPNLGPPGFANGINSAILRYEGAPEVEPKTIQAVSTKPLNEWELHPLKKRIVPGKPQRGGVDKPINLAFGFNGSHFTINGASFDPPGVPILLQIMSGAKAATDLLPRGDVISLPRDADIELTFPATDKAPGAPHPFHLHGHSFAVVRSAGNSTYNYKDPVWRDVVNTGKTGDNVTVRFRTDNPGPWFLHCHIDFHMDAGFAVVMSEAAPDMAAYSPPPQAWTDLCPIYDALPDEDK